MKTIKELEEIIENSEIKLSVDFVIKIMKVLEITQEFIGEGEQRELVENYSNALLHEIGAFISSREISVAEEHGLISEL